MKYIPPAISWLIFAAGMYALVRKFGETFELGRYYMPHMIVSSDGSHFLNGQEIDAFSLAIVRTGLEEEIALAMLATVVTGMCWISWRRRKR